MEHAPACTIGKVHLLVCIYNHYCYWYSVSITDYRHCIESFVMYSLTIVSTLRVIIDLLYMISTSSCVFTH